METIQAVNPSLRDFFHILFKRKKVLVVFFCAIVSVVALATLMTKPSYEASSQILVKVGRENLYIPTIPTIGNPGPIISPNREQQINSEIEILKSGSLSVKVIEAIGADKLYPDMKSNPDEKYSIVDRAAVKFRNNLKVEAVKTSDVIQVSFSHEDPEMAAKAANMLVQHYLDRHLHIHKSQKSHEFFGNQSEVLRNALLQAEARLQDFKKEHDVFSLEEERSLLLAREAELYASTNQTQSQVVETEKRIKQLRAHLAETPPTIVQQEEIDHNPNQIGDLQARLVELELKETQLLIKYTDHSLLVQNVREEIKVVRNKLAELENKRFGVSRTGQNANYQRLQQLIYENEAELKALHAKHETQKTQLGSYREELAKLNRIEVDLNQLMQKADVHRQNYRLYLTKFEESRISDAMDAEKIANVSVVEQANPPIEPVGPKKLLNLALAVFLGLFGGLGIVLFLEYMDDSIEKVEDVENHLQLPVLASIPEFTLTR